jgi:hypothetical protein
MVTISVTPAAFAVIFSTLSKGFAIEVRPDGQDYLVTLDRRMLDRLNARRRPGETYSDVILRLAKG